MFGLSQGAIEAVVDQRVHKMFDVKGWRGKVELMRSKSDLIGQLASLGHRHKSQAWCQYVSVNNMSSALWDMNISVKLSIHDLMLLQPKCSTSAVTYIYLRASVSVPLDSAFISVPVVGVFISNDLCMYFT